MDCTCSAEYNITTAIDGVQRVFVEAFCNTWSSDPNLLYCYLSGGLRAENCPGAKKSSAGDFYWSSDGSVCTEPGEYE